MGLLPRIDTASARRSRLPLPVQTEVTNTAALDAAATTIPSLASRTGGLSMTTVTPLSRNLPMTFPNSRRGQELRGVWRSGGPAGSTTSDSSSGTGWSASTAVRVSDKQRGKPDSVHDAEQLVETWVLQVGVDQHDPAPRTSHPRQRPSWLRSSWGTFTPGGSGDLHHVALGVRTTNCSVVRTVRSASTTQPTLGTPIATTSATP